MKEDENKGESEKKFNLRNYICKKKTVKGKK
jgi:hypothetical protein